MVVTTSLTIPLVAYGTVSCAGQTLTFAPNTSTYILEVTVQVGVPYTITYTPYDATTQFSRFDPAYGAVTLGLATVNPTTGVATATVTITETSPPAAFPFVVVYVKMPFYASLAGDGTVSVSSSNSEDGGSAFSVSGYMNTDFRMFEQNYALGAQTTLTLTYSAPPPGYSFGSWIESPASGPNPITIPMTTNYAANAVTALTNIDISVTSTAGGSVTSSPAGISISGAGTDTGKFPYATQLVLTATPAPGYQFSHWADSSIQTNNPVINIWVQAPYSIDAVFTQGIPPETDIAQVSPRDYVPSQGERADSMHICQCPCACTGCKVAFTSALNRTRQIRALISGSCCQHIPVGVTFNDGGSGYVAGDLVQLKGGVPLEKPALFKVIAVDGGGQITDLKLIYGQPYRTQPIDDVLVLYYTGTGIGGDFAVIWSSCLSPANLYRQ
jgi:hypothetical protein